MSFVNCEYLEYLGYQRLNRIAHRSTLKLNELIKLVLTVAEHS